MPIARPEMTISTKEEADRFIARGDQAEAKGDLQAACGFYLKAIAVAPQYSRAHLNYGVALEVLGDTDHAMQSYKAALTLDPENAYASYNLGKLLYARGALRQAEELLENALKHKREFPEAQVVLSCVHEQEGRLDAAAAALEAALAQRPNWSGALLNYGILLKKLSRLDEAESALSRAITLDTDNVDANYELAKLLRERGALQEAEKRLHRVLKHKPEFQEAHRTLFYVYESQGNLNAAAATLERALKLWPDWDDALRHYGAVLAKLRKLSEAEAALRGAIAIAPDNASGYQALGTILLPQSRVVEALECFGKARQLDPKSFELESAELFTLALCEGISSDTVFTRCKAFGARMEEVHRARFKPFENARDPERRLRVGYVSGDFNSSPVSLYMIPLLERHDKDKYEIYCYSVSTIVDDSTRLVRSRSMMWRDVASMSYSELANSINCDKIDVLVDLSGHSRESRLAVFAQRPAPVQVTWLGYLSTTGLARIQYRICDRYTDPPGIAERFNTETLYRLPHSQWCYRPRSSIDYSCTDIPPFRSNGYITFGSFNDAPKLSQSVRRVWKEILTALPDSRLVVVGVPDGYARECLIQDFQNSDIATTRITVVPRVPFQEYFRWFNAVDIALDAMPYSGHTTTCDTLWMGVPVVTALGSLPVSRGAASILSSVGLAEWIASTPEDYVRLAIRFAHDGALLAELRKKLRHRLRASPIMDEVRFTRDIEEAYRFMWRTWCDTEVSKALN